MQLSAQPLGGIAKSLSKRDRHFEQIQAYKDRFAKRSADWLRERLAFGSLHKEAASAIREVLTERGEPLSAPPGERTQGSKAERSLIPREIENAFYSGQRVGPVSFAVNDGVEVLTGPQAGKIAAVISIEQFSPEVQLLVELDDGSDLVIAQSGLRLLDEP